MENSLFFRLDFDKGKFFEENRLKGLIGGTLKIIRICEIGCFLCHGFYEKVDMSNVQNKDEAHIN